MSAAILYAVLGGICAVGLIWLVLDWALCRFMHWRDQRQLRIRHRDLQRFNMAAFKGTKDRFE